MSDATRAAYDAVAADYAARFRDELAAKPLDRAMLSAFASLVPFELVADVGCGPGHGTAHLKSLGLNAFGVDLSSGMVGQARAAYPDLRFDQGSMEALDVPDGSLAGVVAFYSIINIPPARLPSVFVEFHRVLAPGGQVLVAFQVRSEPAHLTEWFGHSIALDFHRWTPAAVESLLAEAGLPVHARLVREPDDTGEKVPRAYLLAAKSKLSVSRA